MGKLIGSLEKQLTVEGEEINGYMDKMRRCSERGDLISSPRAGPKGLCAESARAVTGRRCSHSGEGEDFLSLQQDFFYGNSCNSGTESRKIVPKVGN